MDGTGEAYELDLLITPAERRIAFAVYRFDDLSNQSGSGEFEIAATQPFMLVNLKLGLEGLAAPDRPPPVIYRQRVTRDLERVMQLIREGLEQALGDREVAIEALMGRAEREIREANTTHRLEAAFQAASAHEG